MKNLNDGSQVIDRTFYFLLDWNDANEKEHIFNTYGVYSLLELNRKQYLELLEYAMKEDLNYMRDKSLKVVKDGEDKNDI
jgi:hypothetical protein